MQRDRQKLWGEMELFCISTEKAVIGEYTFIKMQPILHLGSAQCRFDLRTHPPLPPSPGTLRGPKIGLFCRRNFFK